MKKIVLAAAVLALGTVSASAADLAARPYTKAPPMVAAVYDWSGFYIGANGGWGSSHNCWTNTAVGGVPLRRLPKVATTRLAARSVARSAIAGRLATGCSASKRRATGPTSRFEREPASPASRNRSKIDAFGLFTGQIGYAANNVLFYVKGGAAVTDNRYEGSSSAPAWLDRADDTRWGGTVGAGVEYGFAPNWSFGVEYNHLFMGTNNYAFTNLSRSALTPATTTSGRTLTSSPPASTIASAARLSPGTDLS